MIYVFLSSGLEFDNGTLLFFLSVLFVMSVTLLLLFIRSVKKARSKWGQIKGQKEIITADDFDEFIRKKIQVSKKTTFTLFMIEISDSKSLIKSFGTQQYNNAVDIMINNVRLLINDNLKISKQEEDSIIIYMKGNLSVKNLTQLCSMMLSEIEKSILVAGALKLDFDVNIGVASYPESGHKLEILKQNLQLALVSAKRKGINQAAIYDTNLSNKETKEYKSYLEIKNAIENKEFTLYYQPIVDLSTLEVFGAESLLRWNHKDKGVLPPSKFLSILEHTGDINWVGFWAMEQLIKQAGQWKSQYPDRKLLLSMNLSPKQLMNPQLGDEMRRIIKKYRISSKEFCLEIVEFAMFDSMEQVKDNLIKLRQMGFQIAIDNYGLEFSSLNRLNTMTVDIIKLNRGFIKQSLDNEMAAQIIKMLIKFAAEKEIKVIAEGIEDEEVLAYVKELGITYGQGFYFAKPGNHKELINAVVLTPWQ